MPLRQAVRTCHTTFVIHTVCKSLAKKVVFPSNMSAPLLTPFKIAKDKEITEDGAFARSYLPAERAGSEEDMAGIILYMVSKAGAYINGSVMLVDGGKLATVPATY